MSIYLKNPKSVIVFICDLVSILYNLPLEHCIMHEKLSIAIDG